jgi:hypothetical protein
MSDIEGPRSAAKDRFVTLLGDGTLRVEDSHGARVGHASAAEVTQLLNKLASIDFLNLRCPTDSVDHGFHESVTLVVAGARNRVTLDVDRGGIGATLESVVTDLEKIAERATAADH